MSVDAKAFLSVARESLQQGDASELARVVGYRWTPAQVAGLLKHDDSEVRQTAAVTLGCVGDRQHAAVLAQALHDSDERVSGMAEHGLWTLWFRDGTPEAHQPFEAGLSLLTAQRYTDAIAKFEVACKLDPGFAEASNQCALANYMLEQWEPAIVHCRDTIKKMPCHFGAMACMGHCYAQLNELRRALECYKRALDIHPRMTGVRDALDSLNRCLGDLNDHSGKYDAVSIY